MFYSTLVVCVTRRNPLEMSFVMPSTDLTVQVPSTTTEFQDVHTHCSVGVDEGMADFPKETIQELTKVLETIQESPDKQFKFYLGCDPSNYPNYGSIHFIHQENDKVLYVQSTNGVFNHTSTMTYNPEALTEFIQKMIRAVKAD